MRRLCIALLLSCSSLGVGSLLSSCDPEDRPEPSVGTNSNWLIACVADDECSGEPVCECGACTKRCALDTDCDGLPDARCVSEVSPIAAQGCGVSYPIADASTGTEGMCLPRCTPGTCRDGQACVSGGCVLAPIPDNAFCSPTAATALADRTREEEMLVLITELRAAGGASCGAAGLSVPVPAPRYDAQLTCAARVLAADIVQSRSLAQLDSQGRMTDDRIRAAGYAPRTWGETFAIEVATADEALQLMLSDPDACTALTNARFPEIGVGSAGDVLVVTVGSS